MPDTDSLYHTLGISKDASVEDIKRAFRKKAKEHHPDKGGDSEIFKKVNDAYGILKDPEKRRIYDLTGRTTNDPGGMGGASFFSSFQSHFGGFGPRPAGHSTYTLQCTLREIADGAEKTVVITCDRLCGTCRGSAYQHACQACEGQGRKTVTTMRGMGIIQQSTIVCSTCGGKGYTSPGMCVACKGAGFKKTKETHRIQVPVGAPEGKAIAVLKGCGGKCPGGTTKERDLHIHVRSKPDATFTRKGQHLVLTLKVSLVDVLCGFCKEVPTLKGPFRVRSGPIPLLQGTCLRVPGQGLPGGDLIVQLQVDPVVIRNQHIRSLESIFGGPCTRTDQPPNVQFVQVHPQSNPRGAEEAQQCPVQ